MRISAHRLQHATRAAISTLALGAALAAVPAHADTFQNPGFETGDFTGWTVTGGKWVNTQTWPPPESDYSGPPVLDFIETAGSVDSITGTPTVFSGNYSAKLNDRFNNYDITAIRQSVNNYSGNKLYYAWNAVLEPSHGAEDSPSFIIKVVDKTTNTVVDHIAYSAFTAQQTSIFRQTGNFVTSDWKVEDIDMIAGHDYEMIFVAVDCAHGGHAGYIYVDDFGNVIPTPNAGVTFNPLTDVISGSSVLLPIGGNQDILPNVPYTLSQILSGAVLPNFLGGTLTVDAAGLIVPTSFTVQSQGGFIDTNGFNVTFAGDFSGAGALTKLGAGTLNFAGSLSAINGSLTVNGGTVNVNTNFSANGIVVNASARLGGNGTVIANVHVNSGGFLTPGNSPGTLTVAAGDVTLADDATFAAEIDGTAYTAAGGAGSYDRLALSDGSTFTPNGILTPVLRGISGDATNTFTPQVGDAFLIVDGGTVTDGAFDVVVQPEEGLAANTRFDVLYRPSSVTLAVTPDDMAAWGAGHGWSGNAILAADGLAALRPEAGARAGAGYALYDGLYGLNSAGLGAAFSQLSGEIHADALQAAQGTARSFGGLAMDAAFQPWGCPPEQQSVGPFSDGQPSADAGCGVNATSAGSTVWGRFIASSDDADGDALSSGYTRNARGMIAGANVINRDGTRLGFGGGFTQGDINARNNAKADFDTVSGFVYGSQAFGPLSIGARIGYDRASVDTTRTVNLTTGAPVSKASYHIDTISGALEARYTMDLGKRTALRPVAGIEIARSSADRVTETGAATTSLVLPKEKWTSARTKLGAELAVGVGNPVEAQLFGNWRHELKDENAVRVATLGGASWAVSGVDVDKDGFEAGARLALKASNAVRLELQYSLERNGGIDQQQALAGLAIRF